MWANWVQTQEIYNKSLFDLRRRREIFSAFDKIVTKTCSDLKNNAENRQIATKLGENVIKHGTDLKHAMSDLKRVRKLSDCRKFACLSLSLFLTYIKRKSSQRKRETFSEKFACLSLSLFLSFSLSLREREREREK